MEANFFLYESLAAQAIYHTFFSEIILGIIVMY